MEFQYKNLKGKLEHVEVTDSEVDRHIERLRQRARLVFGGENKNEMLTSRAAVRGRQVLCAAEHGKARCI